MDHCMEFSMFFLFDLSCITNAFDRRDLWNAFSSRFQSAGNQEQLNGIDMHGPNFPSWNSKLSLKWC